jgi:hypothetical protein
MRESAASPPPELKLLSGVLADALALVYAYHDKQVGRKREEYEEAVVWLWREWPEDRRWPTSLRNICDRLKLDIEAVRAEVGVVLLGWKEAPPSLKLRYIAEPTTDKVR